MLRFCFSVKFLLMALTSIAITTANVGVPKVDSEGHLLCDPANPMCQKFQQMLEPVEDDKMGVTSGEDGQQALLCDESDPICQKFYQMLGQQEQDEPANNENYRNCRDGDQSLMCDLKDPICQKFQNMLQQQQHRLSENQRTGNFFQPPQKCDTEENKRRCRLWQKQCYTNGKCGDLVNEENV